MLDFRRIKTMRLRLGKQASSIIKTDKFLPFFRNRQIQFPDEFQKSVEIASKKRDPQRYLATVWKAENIEKSVKWLKSLIMDSVAKLKELFQRKKLEQIKEREEKVSNKENRQKILEMYKIHNFGIRR